MPDVPVSIDQFVTASTHLTPRLISPDSAWNGHIPFAGWIVEAARPRRLVELGTHSGVSYFAFCESVRELGLETECFAVDHWLGDEHAGFYGEQIYNAVSRLNSEHYQEFSRLIRSSFDEALEQFEDGSVDLLHIDGLHTYEAVKHDVESWMPKLSERGVLLLHDTNERKKDFGVYRVLSELGEKWPVFELTHEHGLGVVAVGAEAPAAVVDLTNLTDDATRTVRTLYGNLGKRFSQQAELESLSSELADSRQRESEARHALEQSRVAAEQQRHQLTQALSDLAASRVHLSRAREAETEAKARQASLGEAATRAKRVLERERAKLQSVRAELKSERQKRRQLDKRYERLRRRRSVRIALGLARLATPLYKVRAALEKRGREATTDPSADFEAQPSATAIHPFSIEPQANLDQTAKAQRPRPAAEVPQGQLPIHLTESAPMRVDIVVPIFNAPDSLRRCLDALERNTDTPAHLVLIDDASTDPEIESILGRYADRPNVEVIRNATNLGFTKSVNRGLQATQNDVIILNSDVEVVPGWLDRMRLTAKQHPAAASITPVSNNAGAFSVPEPGAANDMPEYLDLDQVGRLVRSHLRDLTAKTPTGNGFCMFIRRSALDQVGLFDEEAFPRGYGEENDWCMRAERAGWEHIVAGSVYVGHERSASFGDEKYELMERGREILDSRYPEYTERVREFMGSKEIGAIRTAISDAFDSYPTSRSDPRPRLLYVLHSGGGGTRDTTVDLMHAISGRYECFVLRSNGTSVTLGRVRDRGIEHLSSWDLDDPVTPVDHTHKEYRQLVAGILTDLDIELIHIRHLIGHSFDLPGVARSLGIPVVLSLHDFYYICPTVHLLDNNDRFCGGTCTPGQGSCRLPTDWLAPVPHLKHSWVYEWKTRVRELFNQVDTLVTASEAAREVYLRSFPELADGDFRTIEHGRDFPDRDTRLVKPEISATRVKIVLLGNLSVHKGSKLIWDLKSRDTSGLLEFHFMGNVPESLSHLGIHHGTFAREELTDLLAEIRPAMVGVLSVTAETYSHVVSEAWANGLPVLVTDLGAPAERVRRHGGGWIIPHDDPSAALDAIRKVASDADEWARVCAEVSRGSVRMLSEMAADYSLLYESLWSRRKAFPPDDVSPIRAQLAVVGQDGEHPGSVYVRTLTRWTHPTLRRRTLATVFDVEHFLDRKTPDRPDLIYVQRTAVPPRAVERLIERCNELNTALILDLDDDILNLDSGAETYRDYEDKLDSLRELARAADLVTVSTDPLAASLAEVAQRVEVVPNRLDERLWAHPLAELQPTAQPFQILYYGTRTHAEDLELLRPVLERLSDQLPIELNVIGIEDPSPNPAWYNRIDVPLGKARYPQFVGWLHDIKHEFDAAVVPLVDNVFNRSKSDLKFLETSALGLPGIYSNVVPYRHSVAHDATGLLVDNVVEDWCAAIMRLAGDEDLRSELRSRAHDHVMATGLLRDQMPGYLGLVEDLVRSRPT